MPSCDALWGAVVGREPEFGVTSEIPWVTSPRILFWEERIRFPQDIILLGVFDLGESEFAPPRTEFGWRHSGDFWRHTEFRFTSNYCTPKCITGWHRRLYKKIGLFYLSPKFRLLLSEALDSNLSSFFLLFGFLKNSLNF